MIRLTDTELYTLISSFLWPLARIGGLLMADPILGSRAVSVRIRLTLALMLSLVIAPLLPPVPPVAPASYAGLGIMLREMLIGIALGFMTRIALAAIELCGQIAGIQIGLTFSAAYDPINGTQSTIISQLFTLLTILGFFSVDGHLTLIATLARSFEILPIADTPLPAIGFKAIAAQGSFLFLSAVSLSMPFIATILVINVTLGVMTRAASQLNIFSIGFALNLIVGLAILYYAMSAMVPALIRTVDESVQRAGMWVLDMGKQEKSRPKERVFPNPQQR